MQERIDVSILSRCISHIGIRRISQSGAASEFHLWELPQRIRALKNNTFHGTKHTQTLNKQTRKPSPKTVKQKERQFYMPCIVVGYNFCSIIQIVTGVEVIIGNYFPN